MTRPMRSNSDVSADVVGEKILQMVCFKLNDDNFGVNINKVHEINRMIGVTSIPDTPHFVEGLINLRGEVIPVVNLRKRFQIETNGGIHKENRIVVIETADTLIGLMVDSVTEVLRLKSSQIEAPPKLLSIGVEKRYINGVAKLSDELLIVLDTDLIFSEDEYETITSFN